MSDLKKMPVSGEGRAKGQPDGVSGSPGGDADTGVGGRTAGGESAGGAYPNPQSGKEPTNSGLMGHGGQTEIAYHGGGQLGGGGDAPNAATGSDSSSGDESGSAPAPSAERTTRQVGTGGRSFEVVETSGIAAAETTGKIGVDPDEGEQQPGSG